MTRSPSRSRLSSLPSRAHARIRPEPPGGPRLASEIHAPAHRASCALCGSDDVMADEAVHRGLWLLGECGRCGHRWTAGPFDGPLPAPAMVRPLPPATETGGIAAA